MLDEVFGGVDGCLAAAVDEGVGRLCAVVANAVDGVDGTGVGGWLERVRAGVVALLGFFDDEPGWARLLVCEAPDGAQGVIGVLVELLGDRAPSDLMADDRGFGVSSELVGEMVGGGVVSVIQGRMLEQDGGPLVELAPSLMSFVVVPYLGRGVAGVELAGRSPVAEPSEREHKGLRTTYRTARVLRAIARAPRSSNREVADAAGLTDEGQTSKLLRRLERQGLIENVGLGHAYGEANAWLLTGEGWRLAELNSEQQLLASHPGPRRGAHGRAPRSAS